MSHKPYTIRPCKFCGNEFLGRGKAAKCDTCKFTCPNCNGKKKYQRSKYCYSCSLLFRDTSKYKDSIKKAQIAAKKPEAIRKLSRSLMGHNVSDETKRKISEANKGNKHTKEARQKMSDAGKGKSKPRRFRQVMSERMRGKNNPQWKGGISSQRRYAPGWTDRFKNTIRKRDNYTCQHCGLKGKDRDGGALSIHHKDGSLDNHDPENLETICKSCHHKLHNLEKNFKKGGE